jgi:hypothetical protein
MRSTAQILPEAKNWLLTAQQSTIITAGAVAVAAANAL